MSTNPTSPPKTKLIVTERLYDGRPAQVESEDGRFVWWHGVEDDLKDTIVGLQIYQMRYCLADGTSRDVPDDVAGTVRDFWRALRAEQDRAESAHEAAQEEKWKAEHARRYRPEVTGAERVRQERLYDQAHNEGGEGYNPWRD